MRFRQFSLGFLAQQITFLCGIFAILGYYYRFLFPIWTYEPIAIRALALGLLGIPIGAFVGNFWGHSQRFAFAFGAVAVAITTLLQKAHSCLA